MFSGSKRLLNACEVVARFIRELVDMSGVSVFVMSSGSVARLIAGLVVADATSAKTANSSILMGSHVHL